MSACQEISRNIDTMGIAPAGTAPSLWLPDPSMSASTSFDASSHLGNKSLSTPGHQRLLDFAAWAADRPEETIIVGGHSVWFRSFFQLFLPPDLEHPSRRRLSTAALSASRCRCCVGMTAWSTIGSTRRRLRLCMVALPSSE